MTRIPVTISFVTIALNVALNLILMGPLQHRGLALATSIASVANFVLLFEVLRRKIGPMGGRLLARSAGKILLASVLAAMAAYAAATGVERVLGLTSVVARIAVVGSGIASAIAMYLAAVVALRIQESVPLFSFMARVLARTGPKP